MKNSGYELAVSVTPVRTKDFTWSLSFNTSKVKNTVRNNQRENTRDDYLNGTAIVSGEKYGTFTGLRLTRWTRPMEDRHLRIWI